MNITFGRYRLLERLGRGGMAEVWKAKSFGVEGFEKTLVIKRILPELAEHKDFVEMFIHEAKLAVRLSHANIVQVFDLGLARFGEAAEGGEAPSYFMAMEFVHGVDLGALLARCRRRDAPMPIELAVYVAAEVAKGLDHAHRRKDEQLRPLGIVHRDVSPENVLVSFEGEVKVTDFGIAKARGALDTPLEDTRARKLKGKFSYMSPEQARGEDTDARSDLFSLGVLLYELLTGVNPFQAPTTFETLRRVQAVECPPIELLRDGVPRELLALVQTAMAKEPKSRFEGAARMYEALLAILYATQAKAGAHELAALLHPIEEWQARPPERLPRLEQASRAPLSRMLEREADLTPAHSPSSKRDPSTFDPVSFEGPGPASSGMFRAAAAELGSGAWPRAGSPGDTPAPGTSGLEQPFRAPRGRMHERAAAHGERREITALAIRIAPPVSVRGVSARGLGILADAAAAGTIAKWKAIVLRYGGKLREEDDLGFVSLFGLGEPDGRDTELAVRAARIVRSAGETSGFEVGAGVHAARVHVTREGVLVEDDRLTSALGVAGDLARGASGRCLVSAASARALGRTFALDDLPLKDAARVPTGTKVVLEGRAEEPPLVRFIGRKDELRRVGELLAAAIKRRASVLTLRGDHGIGKTRLLAEAERRLQKGGYNIAWYTATCPKAGTEIPLSGIACMLHVLAGVAEGDPPERVLAVQPRLRALGLGEDDVAAVLNVLGAAVPTASPSAKAALRHAFTRIVSSLAEDRPHVFAWDGAHALDDESTAILETVLSRLPSARIAFVFATRAGFALPLEHGARGQSGEAPLHATIELGDLPPPDVEALAAARLGVDAVPVDLLRFVRARGGGHPQFVLEILNALEGASAFSIADRAVVSMRLVDAELTLPKTLRGLVATRIAGLTPKDRATLRAAAILEEPIQTFVLGEMLGQAAATLNGSLATLALRELLVHAGPAEVRFASPIYREVVRDGLPEEAARELHAAAAHALTAAPGDSTEGVYGRIALHLFEAGERAHAAAYFAKSGERRLALKQLEAASRDYVRAMSVADLDAHPASELAGWIGALARGARLLRSIPGAMEACERVLAKIDAGGDRALRVAVRLEYGALLGAMHAFEPARDQFGRAEELAEGDPLLAQPVLLAYAELGARQGDFHHALAMLERSERAGLAAPSPMPRDALHKLWMSRAQAHAGLGDRKAALRALAKDEEECGEEDRILVCERQKVRALIEYFAKDFQAAAVACERAVDTARELGLPYEAAVNLHNLGDSLLREGDLPRAYGAFRQSLETCEEHGFDKLATHDRMFLAYLDAVAGDPHALPALRAGVAYAEANAYVWDEVDGRVLLGKLHARAGELDAAKRELARGRELARDSGNRLLVADAEALLESIGVSPASLDEYDLDASPLPPPASPKLPSPP